MEKEIKEVPETQELPKMESSELEGLLPASEEEISLLLKEDSLAGKKLLSLLSEGKGDSYAGILMEWSHVLASFCQVCTRLKEFQQKGVIFKEIKEKGYI